MNAIIGIITTLFAVALSCLFIIISTRRIDTIARKNITSLREIKREFKRGL
jgi:hypothetical protein